MIDNFRDHAAKECTSVALMALGFVIEQFDLFLRYMGTDTKSNMPTLSGLHAEYIGLLLIVVGLIITGDRLVPSRTTAT